MYVKDTKFEKQQHEATGRHQGNIQRSLKSLHREQANQERQKQRAKDEVARLNGIVPSASSPKPMSKSTHTFSKPEEKKATLADRQKQWEQLAAMGIAVPNGLETDAAADGGWTVVKEEVVGEIGEDGEFKKIANKGVHKRKFDEDEEERIVAEDTIMKHKGWGRTYKSLPGRGSAEDDVEALLANFGASGVKEEHTELSADQNIKEEDAPNSLHDIPTEAEAATKAPKVTVDATVKKEDGAVTPTVVFKKRKKIAK